MVQLPALLYGVAEAIDGRRGYPELAEELSSRLQRELAPEDVQYLVEEKLRPLGLIAAADGTAPEQQEKVDPLLALKFRAALVPASVSRALTTVFLPFFYPVSIVLVLGALLAIDVWFFFFHGVAQPLRELAYNPLLLLMVLGLVVAATALHEIGHATALRYGGGEPGVMGAGIYLVWPAFYTDVTDSYRLDRKSRLRVDLGGIYFNCLFVLLIGAAYAVTRFEPLLVLIIVQHMQIVQQLLPFLRLDGYYILSDLTGVPDMFSRIKPTLQSAVPGRETEPVVEELKPWVRRVTLGWVLFLIPVLLLIFGMMIFNSPRVVSTAWDSLGVQWNRIGNGGAADVSLGLVQSTALVLPLAGMSLASGRVGKRLCAGVWQWSADAPVRRSLVVTAAVAMVAVGAYVLYPNGEYRPIQPSERGTIQGGVSQLRAVPSGRPALTPEREEELGGAPTVRSGKAPAPSSTEEEETPASTSETTTESDTATEPTATTAPAEETEPTDTATVPTETTTTTTETTETTTTETTTTETETTTP